MKYFLLSFLLLLPGCPINRTEPPKPSKPVCICEEPNWCCKGCCCAHGKGGDPTCTCSCCDKCFK